MEEDDGVRDNTVTHSPTNSQQTGNEFRHLNVLLLFLFHLRSSSHYFNWKWKTLEFIIINWGLSIFFIILMILCVHFIRIGLVYWFNVKWTDYFLTLIACFTQSWCSYWNLMRGVMKFLRLKTRYLHAMTFYTW